MVTTPTGFDPEKYWTLLEDDPIRNFIRKSYDEDLNTLLGERPV